MQTRTTCAGLLGLMLGAACSAARHEGSAARHVARTAPPPSEAPSEAPAPPAVSSAPGVARPGWRPAAGRMVGTHPIWVVGREGASPGESECALVEGEIDRAAGVVRPTQRLPCGSLRDVVRLAGDGYAYVDAEGVRVVRAEGAPEHLEGSGRLVVSPAKDRLAILSPEAAVTVYDLATWTPISTSAPIPGLAHPWFTADGALVVQTRADGGGALAIDVASGLEILVADGPSAISPSETKLVALAPRDIDTWELSIYALARGSAPLTPRRVTLARRTDTGYAVRFEGESAVVVSDRYRLPHGVYSDTDVFRIDVATGKVSGTSGTPDDDPERTAVTRAAAPFLDGRSLVDNFLSVRPFVASRTNVVAAVIDSTKDCSQFNCTLADPRFLVVDAGRRAVVADIPLAVNSVGSAGVTDDGRFAFVDAGRLVVVDARTGRTAHLPEVELDWDLGFDDSPPLVVAGGVLDLMDTERDDWPRMLPLSLATL